MKCTICGTPVVLIPSAEERARKDVTGKSAAYYRSLFTAHDSCQLIKRDHPEKLEAHIAYVRATYKRSLLR